MKRIALMTFATTMALSQLSFGEDGQPDRARAAQSAAVARANSAAAAARANTQARQFPRGGQQLQHNPQGLGAGINRSPRLQPRNVNRAQPAATPAPVTTTTPEQTSVRQTNSWNRRNRGRDWQNGAGNNNPNSDWRNRNDANNPRQNGTSQAQNDQNARNRHHNGGGDHHWHRDWDHSHHDRNWWSSRYDRFVLFGGGYYYWDAGFWYPAYGYDPYFSSYAYDAPIYGYNSLPPGEVMSTVQSELARLGYYSGEIDGTYGPLTREALLNYQQSTGLSVTGILDQATLESLGLY